MEDSLFLIDNLERFRAESVCEKLLDAEGKITESIDVGKELGAVSMTAVFSVNENKLCTRIMGRFAPDQSRPGGFAPFT